MNWTTNPLAVGLLLVVLGTPCAFAAGPQATANPPFALGLIDRGAFEPRPTWLDAKDPVGFHFTTYGNLRAAAVAYDNGVADARGKTEQSVAAARLNLDLDLAFTATERIHAFVRPLDTDGSFTRYQISGGGKEGFVDEFDFDFETLFFEGDLGAIRGRSSGKTSSFDLPVAVGRVPVVAQNGIWIEDAFDGVAFGIAAKDGPERDIRNRGLTFFAGFNEVTTAAVPDSNDQSKVFGLAGFADARQGFVELGYGYVDADDTDLSYHNVTAAYSNRYGERVANSVRLIGNSGQRARTKTADGLLVLVESSFITSKPLTLIPYLNLFAGFDTPQPLARDSASGGVLRNTGINFVSDGLTGYPTLDSSAHESYGGALGVEYLFGHDRQIVVEATAVERMGDSVLGSQYALGVHFQQPISNTWMLRLDAMRGWREGLEDVFGVRVEIRHKFCWRFGRGDSRCPGFRPSSTASSAT